MSKNYDNWERLVGAVLRRESDRQFAYIHSRDSSSISVSTLDLSFNSTAHDDDDVGIGMSINSQKDLYRSVLIDSGKLCFSVEPKYGGKIYMVSARELMISWGDNSMYWEWISCSNSSFPEVAKLVRVYWLDIRGKINTQMLSTNTNYGVFFIFRLAERAYGLESVKAVVRLVNEEDDKDAEQRATLCHLQRTISFDRKHQTGRFVTKRFEFGVDPEINSKDEWMELKLGSFYNGEGDDGELEARMMEIKYLNCKSGLIVQGIEFRPI